MYSRYYQLSRRVANDFAEHGCTHMAAAISYYALVSLVPLGIVLISIASYAFSSFDFQRRVLDVVDTVFPLQIQGRANVVQVVQRIIDARGVLGAVGIFGILLSASAMFGALRTALNNAWDVEATHSWPVQKLIDIGAVCAIGLLFAASVAATAILQIARNVTEDLGYLSDLTGPGWDAVFALLPPFISFVAFAVIYRYVPNRHIRWEYVILGALLATLFFEIAKNGFAYYLRYYTTFDETYGSIGAMFAFIAWIYVSAVITLAGAEVTSEYAEMIEEERLKEKSRPRRPRPVSVSADPSKLPPEPTSSL